MSKKVWMGFVAAVVVFAALDFVVHNFLMASGYKETEHLWRKPEDIKWGVYALTLIIFSYLFAFVFSKGYEGKGIAEGFRYGLYIGLMFNISAAYMTYAFMPVNYSFALQWFIYGTIQFIIVGMVLAWVFSWKSKEAAPAS